MGQNWKYEQELQDSLRYIPMKTKATSARLWRFQFVCLRESLMYLRPNHLSINAILSLVDAPVACLEVISPVVT